MADIDRLDEGTLFAERFRIASIAGRGGMGVVYKAHDLTSGQVVALKLFYPGSSQDAERFQREANMLAELRHPAIVSYLAHGRSLEGNPFLAMEWLDGESLEHRLTRQPLSVVDSLLVVTCTAVALNEAHQRSIIHRDIKPSNLFLRAGQIEQATLLDFGIARRTGLAGHLTRSGVVVGTLNYMAPEQAAGRRDIGPAADIFALGCVLFECLIGRPPFSGEDVAAVLVRILFEEAPRLRTLRPELPESLDLLMARMLHKDPAQRPADAAALILALSQVQVSAELLGPSALARTLWRAAPPAAHGELRVISVLIAAPAEAGVQATTLDPSAQERLRSQLESLRRLLLAHGAKSEALLDGSLVASLEDGSDSGVTMVKDRAAQAARLALLLREHWPAARVALATGRAQGTGSDRIPMGEVIEQAVRLLRTSTAVGSTEPILLDDVTAGLLDARFQVRRDAAGTFRLDGAELYADETRPLLGKPTPCLGREAELGTLETLFQECLEESAPRAILITAPPGLGKSRLRHEFLRRMQSRTPAALLLFGRGDSLSVGMPFGLLGQGLRQLCGIFDGESIESRREKLLARVAVRVPASEVTRVAEFLGELCNAPFPDAASILLRAARKDPQVMADQKSRAWLDFLSAETAAHPVIMVLEDLHWGDGLTVKLVRLALQSLTDRPFFVLALGRPEVEALLPRPFPELSASLVLRPLGKRASEKLVQQVLGKQVNPDTVARIVEQAAGHALFLEELIRAAAEGNDAALPKTVLAILQERISRLEPGCRRALLAASIFGETCWLGGIRLLLGMLADDPTLGVSMQLLGRSEILEERLISRIPNEKEYRFRHALMRDATYELLSPEERVSHHLLAGRFLEEHGEADAVTLAEHFRRGHDPARAIAYDLKAAEQARDALDLRAAVASAERGLAGGAQGMQRGALLSVKVDTLIWSEALDESITLGLEALELVPEGGVRWCRLMGGLFSASLLRHQRAVLQRLAQRFLGVEPEPEARSAYISAGGFLSSMMSVAGERVSSRLFLERIQKVGAAVGSADKLALAVVQGSLTCYGFLVRWNPWQCLSAIQESVQNTIEAGVQRPYGMARRLQGQVLLGLGRVSEAEGIFRDALRLATRLRNLFEEALVRCQLSRLLSQYGALPQLDEAEQLAHQALPSKNPCPVGLSHSVLAQVALRRGDLDSAEASARQGSKIIRPFGGYRWEVDARLIQILMQKGRTEEAEHLAVDTLAAYEQSQLENYAEIALRLAVAEAHDAAGNTSSARDALRRALAALQTRAEGIPDPAARTVYLTQVLENARVQELARRWLPEGHAGR